MLLLLSAALYPVRASGQGLGAAGIGMSGSLTDLSPLEVPQGGSVSSNDLFIVVFNFRDTESTVNLSAIAPPGIEVSFTPNETVFTLPPHGHRRIRVAVHVDPTVPPGEYQVVVQANLVLGKPHGAVQVVPGAAQKLILRVVGQYSVVNVVALDPAGEPIRNALIRLYRPISGVLRSVVDSYGRLSARVVPGRYVVRVYLAGEKAAEKTVVLKPFETRNITLHPIIVYVENFVVKPILQDGKPVGVKLNIVVKNIYRVIQDASIVLVVKRNGKLLEERMLVKQSTLPLGRSDYELDYLPPGGMEPGNYTFQVQILGLRNRLLAVSPIRWVYVHPRPLLPRLIPLLLLIALLLAALLSRNRRRKRAGEAARSPPGLKQ